MHFSAFEWYTEHVLGLPKGSTSVEPEEQNSDYESGVTILGDARWRLRTARVTPTKPGAFVAVWQRSESGTTEPFPKEDYTAGLAVFVVDVQRRGAFWFTTEHLRDLGITRSERDSGKRGFRLYPPWCSDLNPQALRTQAAQASAFVEFSRD